MTQINVQRKYSVDEPNKKRSRFWEFCESFGFAVIVLTFAVVVAMLLQQAGVTLEPVHPR